MSARSERVLFLLLALLAFAYVALRAALVPLTHDEAATFQTYVLTGRYLPFLAHWDAGNHLLVTAVGRACYSLFGPGPLSLRSLSVLCYALYAWYAWRLTRPLHQGPIRWSAATSLLLTPFALDFFSMFRGYGPSLAFLIMAVFHLIGYAEHQGRRHLAFMLLAVALGCLASLTLLVLACSFLAIGAVLIARMDSGDVRMWALLLLLGVLPVACSAFYSLGLSERGLLYFGTEEGLFKGTLASLSEWVLGLRMDLLGALLWLAPLAAGVYVCIRSRPPVVVLLVTVVACELLGRVILAEVMDVLYPQDRTAMHLVPLLIVLLAFSLDAMAIRSPRLGWSAVLLLWLPLRAVSQANLDHTQYWPEQSISLRMFEIAEERQRTMERPLQIGAYRQNPRNWMYHAALREDGLNFLDVDGFPQTSSDLLLIDTTHFVIPSGYRTIYAAAHGHLNLAERVRPLEVIIVSDSSWAMAESDEEFAGLWSPDVDLLAGKEWLIEVDAILRSDSDPLELRLVVEAKASNGDLVHYDVIDIEDQRSRWDGDRLHVQRRLPSLAPPPARVVAYFWNPRQASYTAEKMKLVIREVRAGAPSDQ